MILRRIFTWKTCNSAGMKCLSHEQILIHVFKRKTIFYECFREKLHLDTLIPFEQNVQ